MNLRVGMKKSKQKQNASLYHILLCKWQTEDVAQNLVGLPTRTSQVNQLVFQGAWVLVNSKYIQADNQD